MSPSFRTVLRLFLLLQIVVQASAQTAPALREPDWSGIAGYPAPPVISARSAILVDVDARTILYARDPDLVVPPASLTKVVAIDAALRAVQLGEVDADVLFEPPFESWAENQAPGSSLMFLGPGQRLSLDDLLLGLAVPSGNDAAVALASLLDGSVEAFVDRMNARIAELGLVDPYFVEPSGLSPLNSITVRSFARFLIAHIEQFPQSLEQYYGVRTYTYPEPRHLTISGNRSPITQANRNLLLWDFDGVDGFKTGYIEASGYNLAATAERDGRRLIAIVLGIEAESHLVGGMVRASEAATLLEYGFERFSRLRFGYPDAEPVRVYRGQQPWVVPHGQRELVVAVPAGSESRIAGTSTRRDAVVAPIGPVEVGRVSILLDGIELAAQPLVVPRQETGGLWRRLWDSVLLVFRRVGDALLRRPGPMRAP